MDGAQGQEWPRMDTPLIPVTIPDPYAPHRSSGMPIISGYPKFWLLRQAKAKNSVKNLILQTIGKLIFYLQSGF